MCICEVFYIGDYTVDGSLLVFCFVFFAFLVVVVVGTTACLVFEDFCELLNKVGKDVIEHFEAFTELWLCETSCFELVQRCGKGVKGLRKNFVAGFYRKVLYVALKEHIPHSTDCLWLSNYRKTKQNKKYIW